MTMACPYVMGVAVNNSNSCNGTVWSTAAGETNLKDETLMKLTHMAWMRQPSEYSVVTNQPRYTSAVTEKTSVPIILPEEHGCDYESDSNWETREGDALDRNLILQRRKNLVISISKCFFKNIKPGCKNFEQFCFVDGLSLRRVFDKVLSHHRYVSKKADQQSSIPNAKSVAVSISSCLNAQAPPFRPQTKNSAAKEFDIVSNDAKDSLSATPMSFALTSASPSSTIQVDPLQLDTQSSKNSTHKRGYILNRRPLSGNSAQTSYNSQHVNRLDSQSQRQEYLRATLDELDALRLNNFTYFRSDDTNNSTTFVEPFEKDCTNLVSVTSSIRSTVVTSSMPNVLDSISNSEPRGLTSAANLSIATKAEYVPTLLTTFNSSAYISNPTSVIASCSLTNSSCQSKPIVSHYSILGKENHPMVENFELVPGTTAGTAPKSATVTKVATVPNEAICQSFPQLDRTSRLSRGNSESKDNFASHLLQGGSPDTNAVIFRSDSNQCYSNFQTRPKLPGYSFVPPLRDTSGSRSEMCQSQLKELYSSCPNEIVLKSTPDSDGRGVPGSITCDTSMVGMGPHYSMRCDRHDSIKSVQPQRAVDTLVSNVAAANCMTATLSHPLQPVFATGLHTISSSYASDKCTSSHLHSENDVQLPRFLGAPTVNQKPRISEQYPVNSSRVVSVSTGPIRDNPSGWRPKFTPQPSSLPQKVILEPITRNISKCFTELPDGNVFNQQHGDRTDNATINCAPGPQPTSSLIIADRPLPGRVSFFGPDNDALVRGNPDLYHQHPFVKTAEMGKTATQPSIRPSQNTSAVFCPTVPNICDNSSAPHHRGIFGEEGVNETNDTLNRVTPASALISRANISVELPSLGISHTSFASSSDRYPHGLSTVVLRCPTSHSSMSTPVPSQNSIIVDSKYDGTFVTAHGIVHEKTTSPSLGGKSDTMSHLSNIEAGRHLLPISANVLQLKRYESHPVSCSNMAPSLRGTVVNQEPITPQQIDGLAVRSAPTARHGFKFPAGFPQLGGGVENGFFQC